MNIMFEVNCWFAYYVDDEGDYIIESCDDAGNTFQIIVKKKDSRYIKELIKNMNGAT